MKTIASVLLALAATGCASQDHLVFFTNTTIGVEISAEPNTTSPAKFVLGYKRQEGVIDPIRNPGACALVPGEAGRLASCKQVLGGKLMDEGHSVLAKLNFGSSSGSTGAQTAQWFATGAAAKYLAQAPGIAGAVTGDAEIAKAAARQSAFLADEHLSSQVKLAALWTAFAFIEKLDTAEARAVLARVDAFAADYTAPKLAFYSTPTTPEDGAPELVASTPAGTPLDNSDHQALNEYGDKLDGSIQALEYLIANVTVKEQGQDNPPDAERRAELAREYQAQVAALEEFRAAVRASPAVVEALQFFGRTVAGTQE